MNDRLLNACIALLALACIANSVAIAIVASR